MTEELEKFLPGEEDDSPFLDPAAKVMGDVEIGGDALLFPGCVIEGDDSEVDIAQESIIMNRASVRSTKDNPVSIGKNSLISHGARLEGCMIGEDTLIGMDSVVMEGAEIGDQAIIGTDTIVPENMEIPDRKVAVGKPAEIIEEVSEEDLEKIDQIRTTLHERRTELRMIWERGERFDVFEAPKRPEEILGEKEIDAESMERQEVPSLEELKDKLEGLKEDNQTF